MCPLNTELSVLAQVVLPFPSRARQNTVPISTECGSKSCFDQVSYFSPNCTINTSVLLSSQHDFSPFFQPSSSSCFICRQPRLCSYHVSASKVVVFLNSHQGKENVATKHFVTLIEIYLKKIVFKICERPLYKHYFLKSSISTLGLRTAFLQPKVDGFIGWVGE